MNKQDLLDKLSKCNDMDIESGHAIADDLLIKYIDDEDIKKAYDEINKWYA